ncbi:MAG: class I SAM-dependent methyltransferase [Candidatus Heimdallarchaeota archaeon]|nr:class I SAM-dependent methyltransferase [Candidatus Heimdallarchaeota archaeon]MDH5646370.1 class I SAM-dependent methyltransferase [Candidatus Heimdallarchaeota archaeon]
MATSNPKYVEIVKNDFHVLSKSYDLINNFMSLGTDRQFRYIAIKNLIVEPNQSSEFNFWLDIGTGTGHLANELYRQKEGSFVVGLDISASMIQYSKDRDIYSDGCMSLILADSQKTPFRSKSFDGAMSGFVGRHFNDYPVTLGDHHRILRKEGRYAMLEMGRNATRLSFLIDVYVGKMMSLLGKVASFIITKGNAPFRLLENTYNVFYSPSQLQKMFTNVGFKSWYKLGLLGSIVIVFGKKKMN